MMRIFSTLLALFAVSLSLVAQDTEGENPLRLGIKAGANYSNVDDVPLGLVESKFGYHFGGIIEFNILEKFSLLSEVTYSRQGFKQTDIFIQFPDDPPVVFDLVQNIDYINIPFLAQYNLVAGLHGYAGPQLGINVGQSEEVRNEEGGSVPPDFYEGTLDINTLEASAVFGFRYVFVSGFLIDLRYGIGFTEVFVDGNGVNNRNAQLSLGYMFN